jgi:hypothetical protein
MQIARTVSPSPSEGGGHSASRKSLIMHSAAMPRNSLPSYMLHALNENVSRAPTPPAGLGEL